MANPSAGQISGRLTAVKTAQQRISRRMRAIREQLKKIEGDPSTQPWASFKRISKISDLRSPHRTLKDALRHDLLILKSQWRDLKQPAVRQRAVEARANFRSMAYRTLKEAEKQGSLDQGRQDALIKESERVLGMFVGILVTNPSGKNIYAVLKQLEDTLLLGGDSSGGACHRAFQTLTIAGGKLDTKAETAFRKNPKVENFVKLLHARESDILLGGSIKWKPDGWRPAKSGTVHIVAKGDTLSGISQRYYGSPGYWDVIYLENSDVIVDSPDDLKVGWHLKIP